MEKTLDELVEEYQAYNKISSSKSMMHFCLLSEMQVKDRMGLLYEQMIQEIPPMHKTQCHMLGYTAGTVTKAERRKYGKPAPRWKQGIINLHRRTWAEVQSLTKILKKLWR